MRAIKFRLWDKQQKMMCYDDMFRRYINIGSGELIEHQSYGDLIEVDFVTDEYDIMQYTGLRDKNNKEIFEGDVCLVSLKYFGIKDNKSKVIFKDGCFCFQYGCTDEYVKTYSAWDVNTVEVIGNIYEEREELI